MDNPESVSCPFMEFSIHLLANKLDFYTDASGAFGKGFGCVYKSNWAHGAWEPGFIQLLNPSIKSLELCALTVAVELWIESPEIRNYRDHFL